MAEEEGTFQNRHGRNNKGVSAHCLGKYVGAGWAMGSGPPGTGSVQAIRSTAEQKDAKGYLIYFTKMH